MKRSTAIFLCLTVAGRVLGQTGSIGIGTTTPDSSARLDVSATNKGLLIPRMTAAQRAAILNPATGLQVYQTDGLMGVAYFNGQKWINQTYGQSLDSAGKTPYGNYVSTVAGTGVPGSTNGPAATATFTAPVGIAVDGPGNVYVSETANNIIRKITPEGMVSTFAGGGYPSNINGTGTAAFFYHPRGLAVDAADNLYVAEEGAHRIRKITPAGVVTTVAGTGTNGYQDGAASTALFTSPMSLAVDNAGNIYVNDNGNHLIRKITPGGVVSTLAGGAGYPPYGIGYINATGTAAAFNDISDITIDASGNLYAIDVPNSAIRKITPAGVVTTFAGGLTTSIYMNGICAGPNGDIYVTDHYVIRRFSAAGNMSTLAGSGSPGSLDGASATASFDIPVGVAADVLGNVYVTENGNNKIRKIGPAPVYITTGILSNYVLTPSLSNYATTASLSNYATVSSLSGYVNTTTNQAIAGTKTFSSNLGIGTTAPTKQLHLSSAGSTTALIEGTTSSNVALALKTPGNHFQLSAIGNGAATYGFSIYDALHGADRLVIAPTGEVGIGTLSPTSTLSVNGTADKAGGGAWGTYSDARLKKNVADYKSGLKEILAIRPVSFQYNSLSGYTDTAKRFVGVIAQEIEQVLPSTVTILNNDARVKDKRQYDGSELTYTLINAIKEQQAQIAALTQQNIQLMQKVGRLERLTHKTLTKSEGKMVRR